MTRNGHALHDVTEPNLNRDAFPYAELPCIKFGDNGRREDLWPHLSVG